MVRNIEVPEKKVIAKTDLPYDTAFLDQKVDILMGLFSSRVPILGIWVSQSLLTNKDYLRKVCAKYYQEMHAYCFAQIKNVVRNTMTEEEHDFSFDSLKKIVIALESEYGAALPELGIEPSTTIDAFVNNQVKWFSSSFKWNK